MRNRKALLVSAALAFAVPALAQTYPAVLGQIRGGAAETLPGFEIRASSPAELAAFSAREIERWAQLVKEAKIDPE